MRRWYFHWCVSFPSSSSEKLMFSPCFSFASVGFLAARTGAGPVVAGPLQTPARQQVDVRRFLPSSVVNSDTWHDPRHGLDQCAAAVEQKSKGSPSATFCAASSFGTMYCACDSSREPPHSPAPLTF